MILYVVTQLVRQLLQPKMVGDSIGLNPLATLLLLYIGYRLDGVIGMILAVPVGMILINMCQAGAFDYIIDDVKILVEGILGLREEKDANITVQNSQNTAQDGDDTVPVEEDRARDEEKARVKR